MKLIDGLGCLGMALKDVKGHDDWTIYHTWNVTDKSEDTQRECFMQFMDYVDSRPDEKICFISTVHDVFNPYTVWKMEADKHLWMNGNPKSKVIRFPRFVTYGGIFERIITGKPVTPGKIELMSISQAVREIVNCLDSPDRLVVPRGDLVDVEIIKELMI